jgi:hypothetical protein
MLAACGGDDPAGGDDAGPTPDGAADDDAAAGDDAGGPDATAACSTITDEVQCRATPGCVAATCLLCSCTPEFSACVAEGETPPDCPALGCDQPLCCSVQEDCGDTGSFCAAPGTPTCGGACKTDPGDCFADKDCPGGEICEDIDCSCTGAARCVVGCTDSSTCAAGTECDTTSHHCVAITCPRGDECPPNFECVADAVPYCQRATCASDDDCPDGLCVLASCHESYGECRQPLP